MDRIPAVVTVMTPFPFSIDLLQSVAAARAMMGEHAIRHLPVTQGRAIVGVLAERDLGVAERLLEARPDAEPLSVATVCVRPPYVVDTATPLDVVVTEMARRGLGCAIVVKHDKLVGILTMTDVCRHLAERLRGDRTGDDDVA